MYLKGLMILLEKIPIFHTEPCGFGRVTGPKICWALWIQTSPDPRFFFRHLVFLHLPILCAKRRIQKCRHEKKVLFFQRNSKKDLSWRNKLHAVSAERYMETENHGLFDGSKKVFLMVSPKGNPDLVSFFGQRKREIEMISTRTTPLLQVNQPLSLLKQPAPFFHPKQAQDLLFTQLNRTIR